jgi:hypothetical protein
MKYLLRTRMEESRMIEKNALVERKVDTKLVIMSAWISLMFLYIYCDYFSLYRPGQLGSIAGGELGFMDVSQLSLFFASALMVIPSLMILVSALSAARVGRVVNLAASAIYFLVDIGNMLGETWGYYFLFGLLEAGLAIFIFVISLRWPRQEG